MERKSDLLLRLQVLEAENAELKQTLQNVLERLKNVEQNTSTVPVTPPPPRPNGALSSRVKAGYEKEKPRLQAMLRATLEGEGGYMAIQAAGNGQFYDPSQDGPYPTRTIPASELPRAVASILTGEAEVRNKLARLKTLSGHYPENDPRNNFNPKITRLEVELQALKECTDDLVESTPIELGPRIGQPVRREARGHI